jgi:D-3-phosphoglycerate dehydrogenase
MSYKVLLTEDIGEEGKSYLRSMGYEIKIASGRSEDILAKEVEDCDAILARTMKITKKVIGANQKLKVISRFGVGYDNIDVEEATRRGIQVTYCPGANKNTVAEYTMGLILALAKRLFLYDSELREGNFQIRRNLGMDLEGKVLGIVGAGSIGRLVGEKASRGFGMRIIGLSRHRISEEREGIEHTEDLEYLLKNSDFVSLHVPLTKETVRMIGKKELALMKPRAFLINTARGEVVDNDALVEALTQNKIAGAAVDVFEGEVPSRDNPLFKLNNVIVTPHTAALTEEAVRRMSIQSATGIDEVLTGKKPSWPVNFL